MRQGGGPLPVLHTWCRETLNRAPNTLRVIPSVVLSSRRRRLARVLTRQGAHQTDFGPLALGSVILLDALAAVGGGSLSGVSRRMVRG